MGIQAPREGAGRFFKGYGRFYAQGGLGRVGLPIRMSVWPGSGRPLGDSLLDLDREARANLHETDVCDCRIPELPPHCAQDHWDIGQNVAFSPKEG